jgi:hypothetical protein
MIKFGMKSQSKRRLETEALPSGLLDDERFDNNGKRRRPGESLVIPLIKTSASVDAGITAGRCLSVIDDNHLYVS